MQATNGRLSWPARLSLLRQVLVPGMAGFMRTLVGVGQHQSVRLEELPLPDTAAVRHAFEEIDSAASASVVNHSLRTYLWGAALGSVEALSFDPEFLLVGSLLHDLSMSERHGEHQPGCQCFAGQSAFAAFDSMRRFGWPQARLDRLADAVSLHMNGHLPLTPLGDVEAHLLQQGTAFDVVGSRWQDVDQAFRDQVLARHPRLGFNQVFADFIAAECRRRPDSRAALMHQIGLPLMIKFNPYQD